MKEHGVYKFVEKDSKQIVYIGKTNNSFKQRIDAHIKGKGIDEKFKPYVNKCDVYIARLINGTETDIMEKILINKYKPVLNIIDNSEGYSGLIKCEEPIWEKYGSKQREQKRKNKKKEIIPYHSPFFKENNHVVGKRYGETVYLIDSDDIGVLCNFPFFKSDEDAVNFLKEIYEISKKGELRNGFCWVNGEYLETFNEVRRVMGYFANLDSLYLLAHNIPFFIFGEVIWKWGVIKEFYLFSQAINILKDMFESYQQTVSEG